MDYYRPRRSKKGGENMNKNVRISLEACRVNAKLTQSEMAEKLGVTANTVSNWESGKSEPNLSQLRAISEISGIPMDFIFVS